MKQTRRAASAIAGIHANGSGCGETEVVRAARVGLASANSGPCGRRRASQPPLYAP